MWLRLGLSEQLREPLGLFGAVATIPVDWSTELALTGGT